LQKKRRQQEPRRYSTYCVVARSGALFQNQLLNSGEKSMVNSWQSIVQAVYPKVQCATQSKYGMRYLL
jgi:ubiquitin C-terminal hydrolase